MSRMKIPSFSLFRFPASLATVAVGWTCLAVSSRAAEPATQLLAPPLPEDVIAFFLPPTRSDDPYAATRRAVYHFDADASKWAKIYTMPHADGRILGISGYAKSSQVLYVAHTHGGACTPDQGDSWLEFVPLGFQEAPEEFRALEVNPGNRREAVLAYRGQVWITRDYGTTWESLAMPVAPEEVVAIGFSGGDVPRLLALTPNRLLLGPDSQNDWRILLDSSKDLHAMACSSEHGLVLITGEEGIHVLDMSRPGSRTVVPAEKLPSQGSLLTDDFARGILFTAGIHQLHLWDAKEPLAKPILIADAPASEFQGMIQAHPREMEVLIWARDNRLLAITNALASLADTGRVQMDVSRLEFREPRPAPGTPADPIADPTGDRILNEILDREPPLHTIIQKALQHSFYRDGEVDQWSRKVQKRNWIPELRIGGGAREYPKDRTRVVTEVDRYGIPSAEDLRLSDGREPYGFVGITLVWDLDKLLFDPEQVDVNREKRYTVKQRDALVTQVTRLYYDRLKLLTKMHLGRNQLGLSERLELKLSIRERTDLLNGLCGEPVLATE